MFQKLQYVYIFVLEILYINVILELLTSHKMTQVVKSSKVRYICY